MSFQLGTFDTDSIEGFKAILSAWPSVPVDVAFDQIAGDGALYYQTRMTEKEWVFNLEITADGIDSVMEKAHQISAALNPKLGGLQTFIPNAGGDWEWEGVLTTPIEWERDKVLWFSDQGVCRLASQATITTPNPYGYAVGDPVVLSGDGSLALVGGGNTSYYPRVEFRGVLSSSQTLSVGGTTVRGPLTASQTLVLDFEGLDFFIKTTSSGAKVRNVADRLVSFERLEGVGEMTVPVSISGGTFTQARGIVASRRI